MMLANGQEGRPYGKCNRNIPPGGGQPLPGKGEMVR